MKTQFQFFTCLYLLLTFASCKEDPTPYTYRTQNGWNYYGGDAEINQNQNITVDFDIENNLNVDGQVSLTSALSIKNDLNLNDYGKIIIDIPSDNDTIYIHGNMNLNDSLLIYKGYIILDGNLNINTNGIINISNKAHLFVKKDINHNGLMYGSKNVEVLGTFHKNGSSETFTEPLAL